MTIADDLEPEVRAIFYSKWETRNGYVVPDTPSLALGNDAVLLDATFLYADMADSTDLVTLYSRTFAAEVIKAFLLCACRLIRAKGGEIVSFDGDRVMAVFIDDDQATRAVRAALAINHAVVQLIRPTAQKYHSSYVLRHAVGIDSGAILVARTGIRNSNDLVWVGRAANIAAKLSARREPPHGTFITDTVYNAMDTTVRMAGDKNMWTYMANSDRKILGTSYSWKL